MVLFYTFFDQTQERNDYPSCEDTEPHSAVALSGQGSIPINSLDER